MNRFIPIFGVITLIAAVSCKGPSNGDSKAAADSTNQAKKDSGTMKVASSALEDDSKFAVAAASGGLAEVELGHLAEQKSADPKVKEFGSMMVTDHSKANDELTALAKSKNITLPPVPGEDEQKVKSDLAGKSGKDFDKAYIDEMVKDHHKDVKLFEDAKSTVKDPDLLTFIDKTLPVLKKHLQHVEGIKKQVK
jgi:putative membrane protein